MRLFLLRFPALSGLQLFVLLYLAIGDVATANAVTLTVTNTADSGVGSLRAAIAAASDGDAIQFDAALSGQTITLTSAELVIDKSITISGPGPSVLTVTRDQQALRFGIFHVMPGHTVIIEGLAISGGDMDGGIFNDQATLTIGNCIVSNNFSEGDGGGIRNGGTLTITSTLVRFNRAGYTSGFPTGYGGGISNGGTLEINNSTLDGNTADISGGGIINFGTVTITDSTVSGNRAGTDFLNGSGGGGGISNQDHGAVIIRNSTVSGNTARGGDGGGGGGGIVSGSFNAMLEITNSTISGNFANDGGGIHNFGTLRISNSTISANTGNRDGGGVYNGAAFEVGNTILDAGTSGANIFNNSGTVTSHGYNLSSDDGGGFLTATGDQINTDPMLGPLQDNGGPTLTHALLIGSPAINAGDPNFTPPPLYDQRGLGYDRVFNGHIDIGSFELQQVAPTPTPTPGPTPTPTPLPAQALNISTRLRVETGNNVMIGGFIVTGNAPKNVAVRGIGPSLSAFGISDALADPILELRAANGALLFQNDNWQDDPAQAAELTALGLAPQHPSESALVATLQPGASYTAILAGKNGGTGLGLVEIYDINQAADSQLANISTRGFVQTGGNVMIGGFILGGNQNTGVVVRGIGPSLAQFGLSPLLADPTLELHDGNGVLLISNDDWQDDAVQAAQLSAHGLALQDPKESGIFASLSPGTFTAILVGKNGGTGIGLVEIYNVH